MPKKRGKPLALSRPRAAMRGRNFIRNFIIAFFSPNVNRQNAQSFIPKFVHFDEPHRPGAKCIITQKKCINIHFEKDKKI